MSTARAVDVFALRVLSIVVLFLTDIFRICKHGCTVMLFYLQEIHISDFSVIRIFPGMCISAAERQ